MKHLFFTVLIAILFTSCEKNNDNNLEPVSTLSNGLVAHYPFNGNANDLTSNANHGTITGATLTSDRFGNINQAYLFDGSSDYIRVNNSTSLDMKESFSISAWISPDDYEIPGVVVWNGDPAFAKDPFILYFTDRPGYNSIGIRKDVGDGTTINEAFAPSNVIFSGIWSHVVGVCNATTKQMKLYINGELLKTVTVTDMSIGYSTSAFWTMIGAAESTAGIDNFFKGKIDEVRIYNRELTPSEITEIFKL
ncbi:MAG: LamG domain-containing protein [Sphingobacteriales bacterium]|nr:LamG domain-containing protein [Sphingobacteriales bacterium]